MTVQEVKPERVTVSRELLEALLFEHKDSNKFERARAAMIEELTRE